MSAVEKAKLTEAEMLQMLRARYTEKAGNGDAWAFCTHVRNAAGFDASRTIDALAMSLWPSRGLELLGFEVKCSRSDWARELQNPAKAEAFTQLVDRWYLVVSDAAIVLDGELPPTWGLIVARGKKLVCVTEAPRLRPALDKSLPPAFGRSFLAALMRSSNRSGALKKELAEVHEAARAEGKRSAERNVESLQAQLADLQNIIADFERGVGLPGYLSNRWHPADAEKLGQTVRMVLDGNDEARWLEQRLRGIVTNAQSIAQYALDTIGEPA